MVYCSAARYQQHFEEFLTAGLKLENYSLLAIPGGVQILTLVDYLPKFSWACGAGPSSWWTRTTRHASS